MVSKRKIEFDPIINDKLKSLRISLFGKEIAGNFLLIFVVLGSLFLFFILADIAFSFSTSIRYFVLSLYLFLTLYLFIRYILLPILKVFLVIPGYDNISIAKLLINKSEIDDKLLTYLELYDIDSINSLVSKAILQRNVELKSSVKKNISIGSFNVAFLRYSIIILAFFVGFYSLSYQIFNIASIRFFNPGHIVSYKFLDFKILNENLELKQNENFDLHFIVTGSYQPKEVFCRIGDKDFYAKSMDDSTWSFTFNKVNQSVKFFLHDNINQSPIYALKCFLLPVFKGIDVYIHPPKYTDLDLIEVNGIGNFSFPAGSTVEWVFSAENTKKIVISTSTDTAEIISSSDQFKYKKTLYFDFPYSIQLFTGDIWNNTDIQFYGKVISDLYPQIEVKSNPVLELTKPILFEGQIMDDYGFSRLELIVETQDTSVNFTIPISYNSSNQKFFYEVYFYDLSKHLGTNALNYYFVVSDNDVINNFKTTKSQLQVFKIPDEDEINQRMDSTSTQLMSKMTVGIEMLKMLKEQNKELEKRFKTENLNKWEKDQLSDQIIQGQKEMSSIMEEISNMNKEIKSLSNLQNRDTQNQKLTEKQNQIQELLDKIMDKELFDLLQELEKLKSELKPSSKNKDDEKMSLETLEQMMENNLEMLKRFEVEKGLVNLVKDLKSLSDQLKEAKDVNSREDIEEKVKNKLLEHNELIKKNENLKKPLSLEEFKDEKNEINNDLDSNDSNENDKNQNSKSGNKISELASQMEMDLNSNLEEQNSEDIENLKQLRSNLLFISFTQEELIDSLKNISQRSPSFNRVRLNQKNMVDSWGFIRDSLNQLITRNPLMGNLLTDDMNNVGNINTVIIDKLMTEQPQPVYIQQSKLLMHYNNLLLFIDESIQKAEEDMNSSGQGGGCPKPGKGKPSPGEMAKTQNGLKSKLKDLMKQLQDAKNGEGKNNGESISKQLGKYLSQQEQMQKSISDMINQGEMDQPTKNILQEVNKLLDKNINDIINKSINNETILRQERIITRLLESDKAEMERKKEQKRESRENRKQFVTTPTQMTNDTLEDRYIEEFIIYRILNLSKYYLDLHQIYLNHEIESNDN